MVAKARLAGSLALLVGFLSGCATPIRHHQLEAAEQADPGMITARLEAQKYLLEHCQSIYGHESLHGTLVLRFNVNADGTTSLPRILETIGQSAALERCLTDAASRMKFDPLPGGLRAEVEVPVEFTRRSPASAPPEPKAPNFPTRSKRAIRGGNLANP